MYDRRHNAGSSFDPVGKPRILYLRTDKIFAKSFNIFLSILTGNIFAG